VKNYRQKPFSTIKVPAFDWDQVAAGNHFEEKNPPLTERKNISRKTRSDSEPVQEKQMLDRSMKPTCNAILKKSDKKHLKNPVQETYELWV
jgi:hypothetical protein